MENKTRKKPDHTEVQSVRQIKETLHLFHRHKGLVAAVFATVVTISFLHLSYQNPIWRAVGKVDVAAGMNVPLSEIYRKTSQMEILKSDTLRKMVLQKLAEEGWNNCLSPEDRIPKVNLGFIGGTSVVEIKVDSPNPDYAMAYANSLINEYIHFTREQKSESADIASQELTKQVEELKKEIAADEQKLLGYKTSHDIVLYDEAGNIPARYAAELKLRLSDLVTQRSIMEHQINVLKSNKDPYVIESTLLAARNYSTPTFSTVNKSPVADPRASAPKTEIAMQRGLPSVYLLAESETKNYQQLKYQIQQLQESLEEQLTIYKENHPQIIEIKERLKSLENQLNAEVDNLVQRLNARYQTLKMEQAAVEKALNTWENKAASISARGTEYEKLQTELLSKRKLYDMLVQRLNEIGVSSNIGMETVQLVEKIHLLPNPVAPRKTRSLLISAIVGLALGLGTSLTIEYLDDTIRSAEDLQRYTGIPTLAVIPNFRLWENKPASERLIRIGERHNPILEAFRTLRTSVTLSSPNNKLHSVLITSSVPEEGKSLISANLATSLAQMGQKTLLIDADLRKGALHRFFNLNRGKGLADYLMEKINAEETIKSTNLENLFLVTIGYHPDNPPELISSPGMKAFLEHAKKEFDRIIIDAPPALTVTESTILGSLVDGVILVVCGGEIPEALVNRALEILENSGSRIIGGVINRLSEKDFDYYSYRYYHYYYGYHYQQPQSEKVES